MNAIKFQEYDLPNGLHVIFHHDKSAPIVTSLLHYRVGSRNENPQRTGFAHFFEHLMFEATDDIPRATISKHIEGAGGQLNAYTTTDETVYYIELPANEIKLALWIESERMRKLHVESVGVETQRGIVKEERKRRIDNSRNGTWFEKMYKNLFDGCSYSWTPIGSSQHIDVATISEFKDFYNKFYQPNNATLVIVGDFDPKATREYVEAYFGIYSRGAEIKREDFKLNEIQAEYRETVEDTKAQLPAVYIGYRGPKKGHPDAYAIRMLNTVLAGGQSGRLYQRLVNKDQIAVQSYTFNQDLEYAGMLAAVGIVAPGKTPGEVEKAIYEEIERIQNDGVTDQEFQKARNTEEDKFIFGKKNVLEKAQALAKYHTFFGKANEINTEIEHYNKITKADLQRVAKQYFAQDKRVVLTYIPKAK
ncbi:MAG: insulinase family protein [Ignavibacteriae bacterium]|nr:insulinase family protein [Ignavibacteriota bacterium]